MDVLPCGRDEVSVFCSPSRLGSHILDIRWEKSYPSAEIQTVYSTAPVNRAIQLTAIKKSQFYISHFLLLISFLFVGNFVYKLVKTNLFTH